MDAITIEAEVGHDLRLVDALPPEIPIERVKLMIEPIEESPLGTRLRPTREEAVGSRHGAAKMLTGRLVAAGAVHSTESEQRGLMELLGGQKL
jgi:hypothetical protein